MNEDIIAAPIGVKFANPTRRDSLASSIIVNNLGERISNAEALRIYGYDEASVDRILKEKEEEIKRGLTVVGNTNRSNNGNGNQNPNTNPQADGSNLRKEPVNA